MNVSYPQTKPLSYFTFRYPDDETIRFQYLTIDEINQLKKDGVIEVDISIPKGNDNG